MNLKFKNGFNSMEMDLNYFFTYQPGKAFPSFNVKEPVKVKSTDFETIFSVLNTLYDNDSTVRKLIDLRSCNMLFKENWQPENFFSFVNMLLGVYNEDLFQYIDWNQPDISFTNYENHICIDYFTKSFRVDKNSDFVACFKDAISEQEFAEWPYGSMLNEEEFERLGIPNVFEKLRDHRTIFTAPFAFRNIANSLYEVCRKIEDNDKKTIFIWDEEGEKKEPLLYRLLKAPY